MTGDPQPPELSGDDLRRSLARATGRIDARPDDADLARRIDRAHSRRQRRLAFGMVCVLLVGIVGVRLVMVSGGSDTAVVAPSGDDDVLTGTTTQLFERTNDDLLISVSRTVYDPVPACGLVSMVEAKLTGPGVDGTVRSFRLTGALGPLTTQGILVGGRDVVWQIAETPADTVVASISVRMGGFADAMPVTDGIAVLAGAAPAESDRILETTFVGPDGSRVTTANAVVIVKSETPDEVCDSVEGSPPSASASTDTTQPTPTTVIVPRLVDVDEVRATRCAELAMGSGACP